MSRRPQAPGQEGLTLTELMFTLAMMSILLTAVVRFVTGSRLSLSKQEQNAEMLSRSTRVGSNLRTSLGGARLLLADYGGSPDFSSYRTWVRNSIAALAPQTAPPAAFSLPPVVSNLRAAPLYSISPSTQAIWGDELLYLASLRPLTLTVKYGPGATDNAVVVSLDRVQFVYLYPAMVPLGVGGQAQAVRLAEWRSQPYILYGSVKELINTAAAPKLSKTCEALAAMGYNWAFDYDKAGTPTQAWWRVKPPTSPPILEADNAGPSTAPQASWAFLDEFESVADLMPEPGKDRGKIARGGGGSSVAPARYVLAFNTNAVSVSPGVKTAALIANGLPLAVPAHALADRGGKIGFPAGLEIAVIGRPLAREVVLRHVIMSVAASDPKLAPGTRRASEGVEYVEVKNDY